MTETKNLQLSRSLATYLEMMSIQMRDERNNGTIAGQPHVLLIMCQGQLLTEMDFSSARRMLRTSVTQFPDLYIIFITNNQRLVDDLLYGISSYGEQRNTQYFLIKENSFEIARFEKQLMNSLQPLPRRILAPLCKIEPSQHNGYQMIKLVKVNWLLEREIYFLFNPLLLCSLALCPSLIHPQRLP